MEDKMLYIVVGISVLLSISEGLALIPKLKSNSILQLTINILSVLLKGLRGEEELKKE